MHKHPKSGLAPLRAAIAGLLILCQAPIALAGAGWTDYVQIAELVPGNKHYYSFRLALRDNPSGCREKSWFYQNYGTPGSDKMFDSLLRAMQANLRVRVYVTGICNLNGYAEISSLALIR